MERRTRRNKDPKVAKDSDRLVIGCTLSSSVKRPTELPTFSLLPRPLDQPRPLQRQFVEPQSQCSSRDQSPKLPQGGIEEHARTPQHPSLLLWSKGLHQSWGSPGLPPYPNPLVIQLKALKATLGGHTSEAPGCSKTPPFAIRPLTHYCVRWRLPAKSVGWRQRLCFLLSFLAVSATLWLVESVPFLLITRLVNIKVVTRNICPV